jgi:hypothetical protein
VFSDLISIVTRIYEQFSIVDLFSHAPLVFYYFIIPFPIVKTELSVISDSGELQEILGWDGKNHRQRGLHGVVTAMAGAI